MYAVLLALTWCGLAVKDVGDGTFEDDVLEDEENFAEWEGKARGTRTSKDSISSEYGYGYQTAAMKNVSWARSGGAGVVAPEEEVPVVVHGVPVAYNSYRRERDDDEETEPMLP